MINGKLLIAKVVKLWGIRGKVKIKAYTNDIDSLKKYKILKDDENRKYVVDHILKKNDDIILTIKDIIDRNNAQFLIGLDLYIDEQILEEAKEGEYYHYQLIGLDVRSLANVKIGTVKAIHNFGAGDILEIEDLKKSTELYSFTKQVVPKICFRDRYIIIAPMEEI